MTEARPGEYRYRIVIVSNRHILSNPHRLNGWLKMHDLNPHDIPRDSETVCDDIDCTISAATFVCDDNGRLIVEKDHAVTTESMRQLETPALPVPDGVSVHYTNDRPDDLDGLTQWETA